MNKRMPLSTAVGLSAILTAVGAAAGSGLAILIERAAPEHTVATGVGICLTIIAATIVVVAAELRR